MSNGKLVAYTDPGYKWQWFGTVAHFDGQNLNFATPIQQIQQRTMADDLTDEERDKRGSMPFKSLLRDEAKDTKLGHFMKAAHHPKEPPPSESEIQEYAEKYLKEYSDPVDQEHIYGDVAAAYEKRKEYEKVISILKKKMELFGEESYDWDTICDMLDDLAKPDEARKAYRVAIKLYLQDFQKERRDVKNRILNENAFASRTAHTIADILLVSLNLKDEAAKWDDACWVLDPEEAKHLPRTFDYQKKTSKVHAELLDEPFNAKEYYVSLRKKWLSQNDREIFALLRSQGLSQQAEDQMQGKGIDTYTQVWWEQNVLSKLDESNRLKLQSALQERKSLLEQ